MNLLVAFRLCSGMTTAKSSDASGMCKSKIRYAKGELHSYRLHQMKDCEKVPKKYNTNGEKHISVRMISRQHPNAFTKAARGVFFDKHDLFR